MKTREARFFSIPRMLGADVSDLVLESGDCVSGLTREELESIDGAYGRG